MSGKSADLKVQDAGDISQPAPKSSIAAEDPIPITNIPLEKGDDSIPDGGYGWVVIACLVGTNSVTWGINTTYGVYSSYYLAHNHFAGGSTMRYAWVGGTGPAFALLFAPLANYLSKRFSFRVPFILGMICVVLGQALAGVVTTFPAFLALQGIVFGIGLGLTMVPTAPLASHWFDRRLGVAQGIAQAGSGLGGLIICNTTRVALETVGVKWSLVINGLISLIVLLPAACLLRSRDKQLGAKYQPFQLSWIWHPGFLWVWLWGFFTMLSYFVVLYSLASFATGALGLSQKQGAALQSILAAGQMLGRPAWGLILDKGGRVNMTALCYIISSLSCLVIWLPARSFGVLAFFALVQGLTGGTIWSSAAPVINRVVGVQDLGSALGIFWLILVAPVLTAQPISVALLNHSTKVLGRTGATAYFISIGFCGGVGVVGVLLLLGAKRNLQGDWKILKKT